MKPFAKILISKKHGQIIAMKDADDEGQPCLAFYCQIGGKTMTTSVAVTDETIEATRERLNRIFEKLALSQAEAIVAGMKSAQERDQDDPEP